MPVARYFLLFVSMKLQTGFMCINVGFIRNKRISFSICYNEISHEAERKCHILKVNKTIVLKQMIFSYIIVVNVYLQDL